jgi:hypothetical protein
MTHAKLTLSVIPKRMLTTSEAAEHCGRPSKRFEIECPVAPIIFQNGDRRFDVHDLDKWLDSLKTGEDECSDVISKLA